MKRCPVCGTFYDGADKLVCDADGAELEVVRETGTEQDPLIGTIVDGRYEILGVLGRGGMGSVYRAQQTSVEREIALKVIVGETSADLGNRFMLEAKLTSSLRSMHTVTVFDFGVTEDMLYLAMELLEGRSLKEMLDELEQLPWRQAVKIADAIADSLAEAHDKGIIHRDLKPANIHMATIGSETDWVKVLDFGVAKFLHDDSITGLTGTGMVVGTPYYMSPEQARAKPLGACSDIYALGIMLYEMLTGMPPFVGDATVDVLIQHVTDAPNPIHPNDVVEPLPPGLQGLVMSMLAKKPEERPTSARDVRAAFKTLLETGSLEGTYDDPEALGEPRSEDEARKHRGDTTESELSGATVMVTTPAHMGLLDEEDASLLDASEPTRSKAPLFAGLAALLIGGVLFMLTSGDAPQETQASATESASTEVMKSGPSDEAAAEAPSAEEAAKPATGEARAEAAPRKLTLTTTPPGATVLLPNGLQLQGVTPIEMDAPTEATVITLKREGYLDQRHTLGPESAERVTLTLAVDPKVKAAAAAAASKATADKKAKATAERKAKRTKAKSKAKRAKAKVKSPKRAKKPSKDKRKKRRRPGMLR